MAHFHTGVTIVILKIMKFLFFYLSLIFILSVQSQAQLLPPNQPEQDACNAVLLCGNKFFTPYSYKDIGLKRDMPATPCNSPEANSVWLKVIVKTPGSIVFSIVPIDTTDDYDFAVVDLTGKDCDKITSADVVRCNFNNNQQPNRYYYGGIVGLNATSDKQFVQAGANGDPFLKQIMANAGDVYLIMINNFGGNGGPSSGFTLDFTGSTATFVNNGEPEYDSLDLSCGSVEQIEVHMSHQILCSSIAPDGSDFQIEPALATVISAKGLNCTGSNGYTQDISITLSNPISFGTYILKPKVGIDGNTLIDLCEQEQLLSDSFLFNVFSPQVDLGEDLVTCVGNSIRLHADIEGGTSGKTMRWSPALYLDHPSAADPLSTPLKDITYTITVTPERRPECEAKDTIHITVLQGFDLLTKDTNICAGSSVRLNISGDNRYQYRWTPPEGLSDAGSGNTTATPRASTTYTVTASYPGCKDSSRSVTINVENTPAFIGLDKTRDSICTGEAIMFTPRIDGQFAGLMWDFGDGKASLATEDDPVSHAFEKSGSMIVQLHVGFKACPEAVVSESIFVSPIPIVRFDPDTSLCLGREPVKLYNIAANPPGNYHYRWNTGSEDPVLIVTQPGIYKLTMTSEQGCSGTEAISVKKDCYIDIPNAFTPNGDGENDYFFPRQLLTEGLAQFRMQIFNRWGALIFETNSANGHGWDGKLNGKLQPAGVYIYVIDATITGTRQHYQGNVTLIR